MNNKILARVVAVVLSVMMLGTVAFAAPVLNDGATGFTDSVYPGETNFGTQKTMIAFTADSADATAPASADDILAIAQDSAFSPASVSFAADKVPTNCYVIITYGGDTGVVERVALPASLLPTGAEGAMVVGELKTIVVGDKTIKNVIEVNATFPAAEAEVTEVGYKVTKVGGATHEIKKDIATVVEGEGTVTFSLLMVGVPSDATMQFVPYIKY